MCFGHGSRVRRQTAKLFEAAAALGGILSQQPTPIINQLKHYGQKLGLAFQLIDDLLDYKATENDFGKMTGDDFKEGKITLPIILALRRSNQSENNFWKKTIQDGRIDPGDFEKACSILKKREILDDIHKRAKHYGAIAKDALGIFDDSKEKNILLNIVDFVIDRNF